VIETKRAAINDHVRLKGEEGTEFRVTRVTENVVAGPLYCDEIRHGFYEIVRRVIEPWTMENAVKAFARQGELTVVSKSIGIDMEVTGILRDGLCLKVARGVVKWQRLKDAYTLWGGSPCGNIQWEVVQ